MAPKPNYLGEDIPEAGFSCNACDYNTNKVVEIEAHAATADFDPSAEYYCPCGGNVSCTAISLIKGHLKDCADGQKHFPSKPHEDRWMLSSMVAEKCYQKRSNTVHLSIRTVPEDQAATESLEETKRKTLEEG